MRGHPFRDRAPLLVAALLSSSLLVPPFSWTAERSGDNPVRPQVEPRGLLVSDWGLEIFGIRRTAAGHMLEFRYRVLDAEKAAPLFVRKTKPRLILQATGSVFVVPTPGKVGPLRNSDLPIEGRIYWMVFANQGQFIPMGARVTVEIGEFKIQNLVVE